MRGKGAVSRRVVRSQFTKEYVMKFTATAIESAIADARVESFGSSAVFFEPTAARCSSSSSTCCVGCVKL